MSGLNHFAHLSDGGDPKKDYKSEFRRMYERSKEWASIRTSSPRNFLRWTFNTIEYIGTSIEVIGLAGIPFSEGATAAYVQFGFSVNTVGVFGNSLIDIYDGRVGSATLQVGKHFAFYGLGKVINKATYGLTDKWVLDVVTYGYDKIITPYMQEPLNNKFQTFERIEYQKPLKTNQLFIN